jgi:hypothetical protein
MDAGGDENMNQLLDYAIRSLKRYNADAIDYKATRRQLSAARARCTLERVKEVCVEKFAVRDFFARRSCAWLLLGCPVYPLYTCSWEGRERRVVSFWLSRFK